MIISHYLFNGYCEIYHEYEIIKMYFPKCKPINCVTVIILCCNKNAFILFCFRFNTYSRLQTKTNFGSDMDAYLTLLNFNAHLGRRRSEQQCIGFHTKTTARIYCFLNIWIVNVNLYFYIVIVFNLQTC